MNRPILPALLCAVLATAACGGDAALEQTAANDTLAAVTPAATEPTPVVVTPAVTPAPATGAMLDPNAASRDELLALPGMTPELAGALEAGRPYADMRGVDRVLAASLDEQGRDAVYARLWKPLDLNSATAEEIELIPGIDGRMRHEFEEYRPYRGMEQFRTEIGKYVDDAEVTRLEQYVTIGS